MVWIYVHHRKRIRHSAKHKRLLSYRKGQWRYRGKIWALIKSSVSEPSTFPNLNGNKTHAHTSWCPLLHFPLEGLKSSVFATCAGYRISQARKSSDERIWQVLRQLSRAIAPAACSVKRHLNSWIGRESKDARPSTKAVRDLTKDFPRDPRPFSVGMHVWLRIHQIASICPKIMRQLFLDSYCRTQHPRLIRIIQAHINFTSTEWLDYFFTSGMRHYDALILKNSCPKRPRGQNTKRPNGQKTKRPKG